MKKWFAVLLCLLLVISVCVIGASAAEEYTVYVNDSLFVPSVPLKNVNGRIMAPMRDICEKLGFTVTWSPASGNTPESVVISGGCSKGTTEGGDNLRVSMALGLKSYNRLVKSNSPYQVNIQMDVPPQKFGGKIYLPIRALADAVFCDVTWNGVTNTAYINKRNYRIGSTCAGQWSKLLMEDDNGNMGLMDLYGNIIMPLTPAPTMREVLAKSELNEFLKTITYDRMTVTRESGWSRWNFQVNCYDKLGRTILHALFTLDATVHHVEYYKYYPNKNEIYRIDKSVNPNTKKVLDTLYLAEIVKK